MDKEEVYNSSKIGLFIAIVAIAFMFILYYLGCLFTGFFIVILIIISLIGLMVSINQIESDRSNIAFAALILNITAFILSVLILLSFPISIGEETDCILRYSKIKDYINSLIQLI